MIISIKLEPLKLKNILRLHHSNLYLKTIYPSQTNSSVLNGQSVHSRNSAILMPTHTHIAYCQNTCHEILLTIACLSMPDATIIITSYSANEQPDDTFLNLMNNRVEPM